MSSGKDWLGSTGPEFVELCEKWAAELKKPDFAAAYGVDPDEITEVMAAILPFLKAHEAWVGNDSTANKITRRETMKEAKRAMRLFANSSIRWNRKMSAALKAVFGITERDRVPTTVGEVDSFPDGTEDTSIPRQVGIKFKDSVSGRRGKPKGIHGAECRWALLDHEPVSLDELVHSDFSTTSPLTIKLKESDSGKRLYYCLRWETTTNVKGPFSRIRSVIVP